MAAGVVLKLCLVWLLTAEMPTQVLTSQSFCTVEQANAWRLAQIALAPINAMLGIVRDANAEIARINAEADAAIVVLNAEAALSQQPNVCTGSTTCPCTETYIQRYTSNCGIFGLRWSTCTRYRTSYRESTCEKTTYFCCSGYEYSQNRCIRVADNKGTSFVVGFLDNFELVDLELFVISASTEPTNVTISAPGACYTKQLVVTDVAAQVVALPRSLMLSGQERATKGVLVTADREIILYGVNRGRRATDGFLALPVDVLGKEYFVASYSPRSVTCPSEFAIFGVKNATSVSVTVKGTVNYQGRHYTNGSVLELTLDPLEAIQFQGSNMTDLTGTNIVSDKPVSVMSGARCANVPLRYGWAGHLVEHLPPVTSWGRLFVTVPLATRRAGDVFRLVAARNDTVIDVTGLPPRTLQAGDIWELDISSSTYTTMNSSQPIMVLQYSTGEQSDDVVSTGPFMMYLPPVGQFVANYTFSTVAIVNSTNVSYVNIVIKTSETSGLTYDGNPLPSSTEWTLIPDTDLSATQLHISTTGTHKIKHSSVDVAFSSLYYAFSDRDSVGFPLGLRISGESEVTKPVDWDGIDNDCDSPADEELLNRSTVHKDDDNEGLIDEDVADVDDCKLRLDNCDPDAVCVKTHASYKCECKPGFTGDGNNCSAGQCPTMTTPTNGALSPTGANVYQDTVTFTCNTGFILNGADAATCQANGTWSNPVPTCRETTPFGAGVVTGAAVGCFVAGLLLGVAATLLTVLRSAKNDKDDTADGVYEDVRTPDRAAEQRSETGSDVNSYPMRPLPAPPLPTQPNSHYQELRPTVYQSLQEHQGTPRRPQNTTTP
ncbi:FCGBP [Branchiostoma lanceolatum]|uniref:FCGBP protein n=1 Tax=Branchiostoma lanceolatum TaxID=7740 RepID=A0A8J9VJC5_BRALA|nr:FCGBP [Branchiostoma lanceolatum]